jgi:hypothetical protein
MIFQTLVADYTPAGGVLICFAQHFVGYFKYFDDARKDGVSRSARASPQMHEARE